MTPSGNIKLGTCAWAFRDWDDVFYPSTLADGEKLAYYANYLPSVEIDSTFYGAPRPEVVAAWADRTPADFVFTAKMPRVITHEKRLRDCGAELDEFLRSLRPMGEKLGAVLIQLPPTFRPAQGEDAFREFLGLLPTEKIPFAVEFRHTDWHAPRISRLLSDHGVACAWNDLSTIDAQNQAAFGFLPQTADFLYVRLMGDLDTRFAPGDRRKFRYGSLLWSRESALQFWAQKLEKHAGEVRRIFVMISNHYEGFAPLSCQRLARGLGVDLELPSLVRHAAALGEAPVERDEQIELF